MNDEPAIPVPDNPARILTPDQRLRVYVSSTVGELSREREAAVRAISRLRLAPVLFELGARPHAPRVLYRAYLEQSHVFVGIYHEDYGWVAPGETMSGLEDEYRLAGDRPKLIYVKAPAQRIDPRLAALLEEVKGDDQVSYKRFTDADELESLLADDLALLLTERFESAALADSGRPPGGGMRPPAPGSTAGPLPALPVPPTPLVDRENEAAELEELLSTKDVRLVTLTGPAGIGKSRLALEVAARVAPAFADGAHFVPLSAVSQPERVSSLIAGVLGVSDDAGRDRWRLALREVAGRRALLVLDNFEQVTGAAPLLAELLGASADLRLLVTSRAPLRLRGEREFPIHPLALPPPGRPGRGAAAGRYAAVRLFLERAQAVRPDFELDDTNADEVIEICRRLDGIPLALELAAARTRLLPPKTILQRLNTRLDLLTGGARDLPDRQRTMRAAIAWSHDLLGDDERETLARLAVFVDPFTLEAAAAVSAPNPDSDMLDLVAALIDQSLLRTAPAVETEPSFTFLQVIRDFAAERLEASGRDFEVRERHARWFMRMAEEAAPELKSPEQLLWQSRLGRVHGDLRQALRWFADQGRDEELARMSIALSRHWLIHGDYEEGRLWLRRALGRQEVLSDALQAGLLLGMGMLCTVQKDAAADATLRRALELHQRLGDRAGEARVRNMLGVVADDREDYEQARDHYEQALALFRGLDDRRGVAIVLSNLGWMAMYADDLDRADELCQEALLMAQQEEDLPRFLFATLNLAWVRLYQGRVEEALERFSLSFDLGLGLDNKQGLADALDGVARCSHLRGHPERAALLWGARQKLFGSSGLVFSRVEQERFDRSVNEVRCALGEEAFGAAWSAGEELELLDAVAEAREESR